MTKPRRRRLADVVTPGHLIAIDTSTVLAYLAGDEPGSAEATELFDGLLATGRNRAALSTVTVGEILVRPFQRGPAAVSTVEGFLRHFADLDLVPVTYDVAREAARIRASSDLRMPDALIVATARVSDADILVTGDRSWRLRLKALMPELGILEIGRRRLAPFRD